MTSPIDTGKSSPSPSSSSDRSPPAELSVPPLPLLPPNPDSAPSTSPAVVPQSYRLYRRRYLGLLQLSLLNIIVSWNWLTFAAVSTTSAQYFHVSESKINWLSTGFMFAYVVASPLTLYVLNRGVKLSMVVASALMLVGTWVRYAGTRARGGHGSFGTVVLGQVVVGFAQPFVLAAPTRYSDLWFSKRGRIAATAVMSLANPFGGAVGQLVGPFLATTTDQIPNMVLYVAIATTVVTLPTVFLPSRPPLAPSPTSHLNSSPLTFALIRQLLVNPSFHLLAWPFTIYVASFNATSSLLNQILEPYGYSENEAGIDGALLIVVGLVCAAIASPILDRNKSLRLPVAKALVFIISAMFLALIFVPKAHTIAAPYVVSAILGGASFTILPLALELMVDVTFPIGPEMSSTICWAVSQLFGGALIVAMDALRGGQNGEPEGSMYRALVLQAVLCWAVAFLPLGLRAKNLAARGKEEEVAEGESEMEAVAVGHDGADPQMEGGSRGAEGIGGIGNDGT